MYIKLKEEIVLFGTLYMLFFLETAMGNLTYLFLLRTYMKTAIFVRFCTKPELVNSEITN